MGGACKAQANTRKQGGGRMSQAADWGASVGRTRTAGSMPSWAMCASGEAIARVTGSLRHDVSEKARKQATRQHRADLDETDRASPRRETVVALSQAATTQWSQPSLAVHFAAPCRPPRPECQRNGCHRRESIEYRDALFSEFFLRERMLVSHLIAKRREMAR